MLLSRQKTYYVFYIPGGGIYGVIPTYPMEFIEDLTGLKVSQLFNMASGSSVGSLEATALNIPKHPGGTEPRYSARDMRENLMIDVLDIFPPKAFYYGRQMVAELVKLTHEFFTGLFEIAAERCDSGINYGLNSAHSLISRLNPYKAGGNQDGRAAFFEPYNVKPFAAVYKHTFGRWNDFVDGLIEKLLEACRYDIRVLEQKLHNRFAYPDGTLPKLDETLISHHVTSTDITTGDPAYFLHVRDPKTGESVHVSDENLESDDMVCRSTAAQTVFQPYKARNGHHYIDIAHFDTARSALSDIERFVGKGYKIKLVIFGTGNEEKKIDTHQLRNMLFLRQLIGRMGAHLLGIPQNHIRKKELKDLERSLGKENIIYIDRHRARELLEAKYSLKSGNGSGIKEAINLFGKVAVARTRMMELNDIPKSAFFDVTKEHVDLVNKFGYATVWENAVPLIELSKDLVRNAVTHGRITKQDGDERIRFIDSLTDVPDDLDAAFHDAATLEDESKDDNRRREIYRKWPFLKDLQTVFSEAQKGADGKPLTTFTPLKYGGAMTRLENLLPPPQSLRDRGRRALQSAAGSLDTPTSVLQGLVGGRIGNPEIGRKPEG